MKSSYAEPKESEAVYASDRRARFRTHGLIVSPGPLIPEMSLFFTN